MLSSLGDSLAGQIARRLLANQKRVKSDKSDKSGSKEWRGMTAVHDTMALEQRFRQKHKLTEGEFKVEKRAWWRLFQRTTELTNLAEGHRLFIEPDSNVCGSRWTTIMLDHYFKQHHVRTFEPFAAKVSKELVRKVKQSIATVYKGIHGTTGHHPSSPSNGLKDIVTLNRAEAVSRLCIDAFLLPITTHTDCKLDVETNHFDNVFPNNRLDYKIYRKGVPIGLLEAKRISTFKPNALAQTLMQLVQLWSHAPTTTSTTTSTSSATATATASASTGVGLRDVRVGILTDGYRFLFVKLGKQNVAISRLKTCETDRDLATIIGTMVGLLGAKDFKLSNTTCKQH